MIKENDLNEVFVKKAWITVTSKKELEIRSEGMDVEK